MRLDKYLAQASMGTRSEVKKFIKSGRVFVNGVLAKDPQRQVEESDDITLDGKHVQYEAHVYYMLNKPKGVVSATQDRDSRTVVDLLGDTGKRKLFPVGRLDKDTEGLLLLTDDGVLAHALLAPGKHVWKTYRVCAQGDVSAEECRQLECGVDIGDEKPTLPAKVERIEKTEAFLQEKDDRGWDFEAVEEGEKYTVLKLSIREGRYHQIKRMMQKIGHPVLSLKRLSMGDLQLDETLRPGEYRKLTAEEMEACRRGCAEL